MFFQESPIVLFDSWQCPSLFGLKNESDQSARVLATRLEPSETYSEAGIYSEKGAWPRRRRVVTPFQGVQIREIFLPDTETREEVVKASKTRRVFHPCE